MKPKEILLFGASGQIGRHLIRKLTKNNYKVTAVTRNYHQKAFILKTQANPGFLDIIEANIYDYNLLNSIIQKVDICINFVRNLDENKKTKIKTLHTDFPFILSKLCKENNLEQFVHISSLGIDQAKDSKYANSKLEGENLIKSTFPKSTILRPSLVYSVDDKATTKFLSLLNMLPFFPLYYSGRTKFKPIHVSDLTKIIFNIVDRKIQSETIECIGPETITLKEILEKLLISIDKKRLLVPMPLFIGKITATIMENIMSNPLISNDQLKILKYDNIPSGKNKTNFDLNLNANLKFDEEILKYSYMWKESGEYSKKKYNN